MSVISAPMSSSSGNRGRYGGCSVLRTRLTTSARRAHWRQCLAQINYSHACILILFENSWMKSLDLKSETTAIGIHAYTDAWACVCTCVCVGVGEYGNNINCIHFVHALRRNSEMGDNILLRTIENNSTTQPCEEPNVWSEWNGSYGHAVTKRSSAR